MPAPFIPRALSSARVTVGVASASTALPSPGGQVILKAANTNSDHIHIEFGISTVTAIVPTAGGGFMGGLTLGPGDMVELTPPVGQLGGATPLVATHIAYISLTAAQSLFIAAGVDG